MQTFVYPTTQFHIPEIWILRNTDVRTPNLTSVTFCSCKKIPRKRFGLGFAGNRIYKLILKCSEQNNNFYENETSLETAALCYHLFLQLHSLLSFSGFVKCTQKKYLNMPAKILYLKFKTTPTNSLYYNIKFLQLKHYNSDMFRLFLGGEGILNECKSVSVRNVDSVDLSLIKNVDLHFLRKAYKK